jgi:hypothetical protein
VDLRCLEHWKAQRRMPALRQMGVDEIHLGRTEVPDGGEQPDTAEPLWFEGERKKETLGQFFREEERALGSGGGSKRPTWTFRQSIEQWVPSAGSILCGFTKCSLPINVRIFPIGCCRGPHLLTGPFSGLKLTRPREDSSFSRAQASENWTAAP